MGLLHDYRFSLAWHDADEIPLSSCYLAVYKKWSKERNQKRAEAAKATKKRKSEAAAGPGIEATTEGAAAATEGAAPDAAVVLLS